MAEKKRILIQLDGDPHPSSFDRVVAIDAGVEQLFSYGGVRPEDVRSLIYGAIFTRGAKELHRTAVFIGGSDVGVGEETLQAARESFFGPLRVSLMLDSGGANTTAAAAVLAVQRELRLEGALALVLGGTGPVGQRVARLLARERASVRLGSRQRERAAATCERIARTVGEAKVEPVATGSQPELRRALSGVQVVVAAGAAGVTLLPRAARAESGLRALVDLNAVPPAGIEGVEGTDAGTDREGTKCYGAIGVGGTKMKIHKAALARLFERNDLILDAEEIYQLGKEIATS